MYQPTKLTLSVPRRQQPGKESSMKCYLYKNYAQNMLGRQGNAMQRVRKIKAKNWEKWKVL